MLFDFLLMPPYEERKVARFDGKDFSVDTCAITDSTKPYETGVRHPKYNDGAWVIVEEERDGHNLDWRNYALGLEAENYDLQQEVAELQDIVAEKEKELDELDAQLAAEQARCSNCGRNK